MAATARSRSIMSAGRGASALAETLEGAFFVCLPFVSGRPSDADNPADDLSVFELDRFGVNDKQ